MGQLQTYSFILLATAVSAASFAEDAMIMLEDGLNQNINSFASQFCADSDKASKVTIGGGSCEVNYKALFNICKSYDPDQYAKGNKIPAQPELMSMFIPAANIAFMHQAIERCVLAEATEKTDHVDN